MSRQTIIGFTTLFMHIISAINKHFSKILILTSTIYNNNNINKNFVHNFYFAIYYIIIIKKHAF